MTETIERPPLNPAVAHVAQFFSYAHLPPHLREVSRKFADLADYCVDNLPSNPELTVALRKLLEAKDCAVRTLVASPPLPQAKRDAG